MLVTTMRHVFWCFFFVVPVASGLTVSRFYKDDFTENTGSQCSYIGLATVDELRHHAYELATCSRRDRNVSFCCELRSVSEVMSGVYSVRGRDAVCDMTLSGGGWMVIQRSGLTSDSGAGSFEKNWTVYERGFGDPVGDFWLGLEALHDFTSTWPTELHIDLLMNDSKVFARYDHFSVGDVGSNYLLSVSGFNGSAPDFLSMHNGSPFSTFDQDNDGSYFLNCAAVARGGWWYTRGCGPVLPILVYSDDRVFVRWGNFTFTGTEMKIRPHHRLCGNL